MTIRWFSFVVLVLATVVAAESKKDDFQGWTCDEMTPNLCDNLAVTEGDVTTYDNIEVHYWRYAPPTLKDENNNVPPIIVINGGPGLAHNYDLPWRQLACRGREVIYYDQAGTGESKLPKNTTVKEDFPFLLDVSYYGQQELPQVIQALSIEEYHIVADSWGTMVAMQYATHVEDPNLLSLVMNGPVPKAADYIDKAWDVSTGSIGTLPDYIESRIFALEASGKDESEEMMDIQQVVFTDFYTRNGIFPDCFMDSMLFSNEEIGVGMWGAVDFLDITGTLKTFDLTPLLGDKLADKPALLTSGEFDMVRPVVVKDMHERMRLSETILFAGAGHASLLDVTGELLDAVDDFIGRVETAWMKGVQFQPKKNHEVDPDDDPPSIMWFVDAAAFVVLAFVLGVVVGRRGAQKTHYNQIG